MIRLLLLAFIGLALVQPRPRLKRIAGRLIHPASPHVH